MAAVPPAIQALLDALDAGARPNGIALTAGSSVPEFGLLGYTSPSAGGNTSGAAMSPGTAVALPPRHEQVASGPVLLAVALVSVVSALLARTAQGRRGRIER